MAPISGTSSKRPAHQHTRSTSSVLKSIINPRTHKRTASAGFGLQSTKESLKENCTPLAVDQKVPNELPVLPFDKSSQNAQLGDIITPQASQKRSPSSERENEQTPGPEGEQRGRTLHKKTLSSVSLSTLAKKQKEKSPKPRSKSRKPKKTKSRTNLGGLLSRSNSVNKKEKVDQNGSKKVENESRAKPEQPRQTPIYAQFSSQSPNQPDVDRQQFGQNFEKSGVLSQVVNGQNGSRAKSTVEEFDKKARPISVDDAAVIEKNFESLLDSRNVPQNMRSRLRSLEIHIKADFIKQDKAEHGVPPSTPVSYQKTTGGNASRPQSSCKQVQSETSNEGRKGRSRSRTFTLTRAKEKSPFRRKRAGTIPDEERDSVSISRCSSSTSLRSMNSEASQSRESLDVAQATGPEEFVEYLKLQKAPQEVEVGRLHKLRIVLRNERVAWVNAFIDIGGMNEIVGLLRRIMEIEWREEHEDTLLHEILLCIKALCTTSKALSTLDSMADNLFPSLLGMLFDEERKGPSGFTTREIIVHLLVTHLSDASPETRPERARKVLTYLQNPSPPDQAQPLGFIASMHQTRPYSTWCKEVVSVTKEVFWIFLHHLNVITPTAELNQPNTYYERHFPKERPLVAAAPYVGGVEWEATNYLASHIELLNALIASTPTREERNKLRSELRASGFERLMGGSLRTCKEKFYIAVHVALRTWIAAAAEDDWSVRDVRMGPPAEDKPKTVPNSPNKKPVPAPKLELPKLDVGAGQSEGWL